MSAAALERLGRAVRPLPADAAAQEPGRDKDGTRGLEALLLLGALQDALPANAGPETARMALGLVELVLRGAP